MMRDKKKIPGSENPEKHTGLKKGRIKKSAAGITAIVSTMKEVIGEAGVKRGLKALANLNQKGGFDCPSCAWPDPDDDRSSIGEYCENGAKAVAEEATSKKLTASFFAKYSVEKLSALSDFEIGRKGRIAEPVYLKPGGTHYEPISWKDAFHKIADALNKLASPDKAVFYTSGRTSNEAAFLYQLFVREYGTNNLPDCSNL
jgi:anaerobic selenocysteine-containing dehydrogenase